MNRFVNVLNLIIILVCVVSDMRMLVRFGVIEIRESEIILTSFPYLYNF